MRAKYRELDGKRFFLARKARNYTSSAIWRFELSPDKKEMGLVQEGETKPHVMYSEGTLKSILINMDINEPTCRILLTDTQEEMIRKIPHISICQTVLKRTPMYYTFSERGRLNTVRDFYLRNKK